MRTNLRDSVKPEMLAPGTKARIVARNTFQFTAPNGDKVTRLHNTDIVRVTPKGKTILQTGGWRTVTTKERMNRYASVNISSHRGAWSVSGVPFYDGIVLPDALSSPKAQAKGAAVAKREATLRKQIKVFLCETLPADAKQVPAPSGGDCWLCMMESAKLSEAMNKNGAGLMWGAHDISADSEHIRSHVREKYMHGSLIKNACMWRMGERWMNCIQYWGADRLRQVVRDYLNARLGLAR